MTEDEAIATMAVVAAGEVACAGMLSVGWTAGPAGEAAAVVGCGALAIGTSISWAVDFFD